jgi:signal transduction histidine kinase
LASRPAEPASGLDACLTVVRRPSYPAVVSAEPREFEPEPWGEDPRLVEVLGAQGAAGFRSLLDGFPEAVGVLWAIRDPGGAIVDFAFGYGNPAMMRRFRIPPETADRYTLLEALGPMRDSRAFRSYVEVCGTGAPLVNEVTYDSPFGDGYMLGTFLHRVARIGDGLIVFLHDITEERRMEAELKAYADVVAHDLSSPLAGIALLVTLLEQSPDKPPAREVLAELRASTRRALALVDGVLDYARSGELTLERVALGDVMAEVAADLRHALQDAEATLVVGDLPEVRADPRQLRRVMQNLVGNALKFHGENPPRVEISADRGREEWIVTVRDNGIGIDRENARRIFAMFSRVERRVEGSGIGLAVCRRVVEAHGGRIWVEPSEGGGSAFHFTLPFGLQPPSGAGVRPAATP